jgi:hypothetical protein
MTDEADTLANDNEAPSVAKAHEEPAILRLETRLARAEAQIHALQDSFSAVLQGQQRAKHRALMIRLVVLLIMLGAFFFMRSAQGGAG